MSYIYTDVSNRLILGNEEYARQTNLPGSLWQKVRLGVRYCMQDTGGDVITPTFVVGLSEGVTQTFRGANTTGYLGIGWTANSYLRTIGIFNGLPIYHWSNNAINSFQRTGGTTTTGSTSTSYSYGLTASRPNLIFMDITKLTSGLASISFTVGYNETGADPIPIDQTTFFTFIEQEVLGTHQPTGYQTGTFGNVVYTGTSLNALDTISISWGKATPVMEILDIILLRFA